MFHIKLLNCHRIDILGANYCKDGHEKKHAKNKKNMNICIDISLTKKSKNKCCPQRKKTAYLGHRRRSKSEGATVQPHLVRSGESHPPKWALPEMGWMEPWPNVLLNLQRTYHIYSGKLGNSQLGTPSSEENWELMIEDPFGTSELSCFTYMHIAHIYIYIIYNIIAWPGLHTLHFI